MVVWKNTMESLGIFMIIVIAQPAFAQLYQEYYGNSCPQVENIVRSSIMSSLVSDPTATAALLRLVFHDCQVGACDASIMLSTRGPITSELVSDHNFGVRQLGFIDRAKAAVDATCGRGKVSCADIIAMAGRDAVAISGGPNIAIPLGRKDSTFTNNREADNELPPATTDVSRLLFVFAAYGMTPEESVAILGGGHTLGVSHCVNFVNRLYPTQDDKLGTFYANRLRVSCPVSNPRFMFNGTSVPNDFTPLIFDNRYFQDVSNDLGLLTVDADLNVDPRTRPIVEKFATNQQEFFNAFSSAFVKLTSARVLRRGEVRNNCRFTNFQR